MLWRWLHIDWPDWLTTGDRYRIRRLGPNAWTVEETPEGRAERVLAALEQHKANGTHITLTPGQRQHLASVRAENDRILRRGRWTL